MKFKLKLKSLSELIQKVVILDAEVKELQQDKI